MTDEQIQEALERANAVVDGFRCVTDRTARDAQKLALECQRQRAAMRRLENKLKESGAQVGAGSFIDELMRGYW